MHKLPVSSGAAGFLFVAGSMLIFLPSIPALRWFLGVSIELGLAVAGALKLFHKRFAAVPQELLKLTY
jgi:hypothetical protein